VLGPSSPESDLDMVELCLGFAEDLVGGNWSLSGCRIAE
jgi:hypothetical protein